MITVIAKPGRTPARLLDYLSSPRRTGASLLVTNLVGNSVAEWSIELEAVARQRPRGQKRFVRHIVLSFAPEDRLDRGALAAIAERYLERMGYGEAPMVGFLHVDKAHWHIHLVTTATTFDGKAISDSHDWHRSMRVARELEQAWGLRAVESPRSDAPKRAPRRPEGQALVRREEPPARLQFQNEIAELALRSTRLLEAVARLRTRGFTVAARFDPKTGQLAGISFARDGVAFSGAQLGRDFRGNRFLEAFQLRFDPEREAASLASLLERGSGATRAELEAPLPASALPEGTYQAAAVPLAVLVDPSRHIDRAALAGLESRLDRSGLERTAGELARRYPESAVLVRPIDPEASWVGLRDVSTEALARLERVGAEPAWTIAVGEGRFDVLLQLRERLSEREERSLRESLAAEVGLELTRGVFLDGVRAPGSRVAPDSSETARLVAVRGEPISAEAFWVGQVRDELERQEVLRPIEARPRPESLHGAPDVVKQEAAIRWLEEGDLGRSPWRDGGEPPLPMEPALRVAQNRLEAARGRAEALAEPARTAGAGAEPIAQYRAALAELGPLEELVRALSRRVALVLRHESRLEQLGSVGALATVPVTRPSAVRAVIAGSAREVLEAFLQYRADLARRAAYEALVVPLASSAEERLPRALERVRHGSPTPEALRELSAALVASEGAGAVHVPPAEPQGEPRAWIARLLHLERAIAHQAERLLELGPSAAPRELRRRLLADATEAVALHQRFDRLLRQEWGLVDPAASPAGLSREAWQLAWIGRAVETHKLSRELAASLVANASPSPAVSAGVAAHALAIAAPAVRRALGLAASWVERVLVRER